MQVRSAFLKRRVRIDLYYGDGKRPAGLVQALFMNDGQDMQALRLRSAMNDCRRRGMASEWMVVAIHPGNRMQEYGVAHSADYAGRGSLAGAYARFLTEELIPLLQYRFRLSAGPHAIAGCSLGGLSAFDIAWNHPELFDRVGVFSGALWWRARAFRAEEPDADRMVHAMVEGSKKVPSLRYWFQTGTEDEEEDRNGNGIIDAIDDTLDLMAALQERGVLEEAMRYVEVEGGRHHPDTWAGVLPEFLSWAFALSPNQPEQQPDESDG